MNETLKTLHLFAGIGGGLLADIILGHKPICAVEWDSYCCSVLRERASEGWFPDLQVFDGDVRVFNASDWKGKVDIIHAGFPCQPHSVAGKRKGADDDRNLWPATARVIGEILPRWVFLENVPGIISNGFIETVLSDLACLGYDARWTVLGAYQVGAPHRRDRWFCLANATGKQTFREGQGRFFPITPQCCKDVANATGVRREEGGDYAGTEFQKAGGYKPCLSGEILADPFDNGSHHSEKNATKSCKDKQKNRVSVGNGSWWKSEPDLGRVAYGVASRVDRLKALGNGQVPLQAAIAFKILIGDIL